MAEAGWTPVLTGDTYCSPLCGGRCTKAQYDFACREAQALADRMGRGWTPHVWENLGWHYDVHCGSARITPPQRGSKAFTAWVHPQGARPFFTCSDDPEEALGLALQEARTYATRVSQALDDIARLRDGAGGPAHG